MKSPHSPNGHTGTDASPAIPATRPLVDLRRWTAHGTKPRLVTLNWTSVVRMSSHR